MLLNAVVGRHGRGECSSWCGGIGQVTNCSQDDELERASTEDHAGVNSDRVDHDSDGDQEADSDVEMIDVERKELNITTTGIQDGGSKNNDDGENNGGGENDGLADVDVIDVDCEDVQRNEHTPEDEEFEEFEKDSGYFEGYVFSEDEEPFDEGIHPPICTLEGELAKARALHLSICAWLPLGSVPILTLRRVIGNQL
jgi:hypothetical protein